MKFSLQLPDDHQDLKSPILKGKLPITIFNQPFTSSFTSAINASSELSFSLSTNFPSGPSLKLTYSPKAAAGAAAAASPFTLSLKSGLGLFGSPGDSPLVFSSQFSLSPAKPFNPSFALLLKPRFGSFCLRKSTNSSPSGRDGVRLDSGSRLDPKFGGGFAADEAMGWQELKLEAGGGHGCQDEELGDHSNGGVFQRRLDGVFRGAGVMARTVLPVTKRVAVNLRWRMNFSTSPVTKMPYLTVNKLSVERVEDKEEEEEKKKVEEGGDVEFLKGMLFWVKKDVETLEKENREMKQLLEEIKLGAVRNGAAPSANLRNGGQENGWRKKTSADEEIEGKNNRRGGEKNGSKGLGSMNRANEVGSELERAIKAASQVKA